MVAKISIFVFVAVLSSALALTEIALPDRTISHISNPLFGTSITIDKRLSESLESCHVIFPNNLIYEAWPNSNIKASGVAYAPSSPLHRVCGVYFLGVGADMSGTYELISVQRDEVGQAYVYSQKYHMTFTPTQVVFPTV